VATFGATLVVCMAAGRLVRRRPVPNAARRAVESEIPRGLEASHD
jgi:hypothetical protein